MTNGGSGEEPWERIALGVLRRNDWAGAAYLGADVMGSLDMAEGVDATRTERYVTLALASKFREESDSRDPPVSAFVEWLQNRLAPVDEEDILHSAMGDDGIPNVTCPDCGWSSEDWRDTDDPALVERGESVVAECPGCGRELFRLT